MKLLIIAAGEGSRLRQEGILTPKPLIELNGQTLIERLIWMSIDHSFSEVCVIVNNLYPELKNYFTSHSFPIPVQIVVKTTESSLHSFYELRHFINSEPFILTTVDPVYQPEALEGYLKYIENHSDYDGVMALTSFVDDEKPLWVLTNDKMDILQYQSFKGNAQYVSAGFYYFTAKVAPLLEEAMQHKMHKMRSFQQFLIDKGKKLAGYNMGKVIDIDHISDIKKATEMLKE